MNASANDQKPKRWLNSRTIGFRPSDQPCRLQIAHLHAARFLQSHRQTAPAALLIGPPNAQDSELSYVNEQVCATTLYHRV